MNSDCLETFSRPIGRHVCVLPCGADRRTIFQRGIVMKRLIVILAATTLLAACAQTGNTRDEKSEAKSAAVAANGEAAFVDHCAVCHETGMLGAPRAGEPEDWQGRSTLWQAVLMDHARTGYYDMPPRGGKTDLPDEVVDAAAEYMLEMTFRNRPGD